MELQVNPDHRKKRGIYAVSRPARRSDIPLAQRMVQIIDAAEQDWGDAYNMKAWAIAHAQLCQSTSPLRIFVVHPELVNPQESSVNARFPARAVFNPVILSAPKEIVTYKPVRKTVLNEKTGKREIKENVKEEHKAPNVHTIKEGCMSFPKRKPKNKERVFRITVRYWYPRKIFGVWVLWRKTETVEGLKAQVFQHEIQHFEGENIFYDKKDSLNKTNMESTLNIEGTRTYQTNTKLQKFIIYKICYPIVNNIGLNRPFNLLRHKLNLYPEYPDGRCQWCGDKHTF